MQGVQQRAKGVVLAPSPSVVLLSSLLCSLQRLQNVLVLPAVLDVLLELGLEPCHVLVGGVIERLLELVNLSQRALKAAMESG